MIDNTTSRGRTIRFLWEGTDEEFRQMLELMGETPLPKYIKRKPEEEDKERYQTVYAKHEGAVAAPPPAFISSKELIKGSKSRGSVLQKSPCIPGSAHSAPLKWKT